MEIKVYPTAVISTLHITAKDADLMTDPKAPYRTAEIDPVHDDDDGGPGCVFYIPDHDCDKCEDVCARLEKFGFSEAFRNLFAELYKQQFAFVIFDRDGDTLKDAPIFDW